MKKKLLLIGLIIILFGGSLYVVKNFNMTKKSVTKTDETNKVAKGILNQVIKTKAPDFKLKDLLGKNVSLSDLKGKDVYVNFWASWCPPCKAEMPDIEKLYQESKKTNLVILGINLGEDSNTVKNFIKKNNYHFNILLDSDQSIGIKYNITAIPASFFIDKNGNIVNTKVGEMTIDEMKDYINKLDK